MMALPLLTCSARLPVYTLLIATLFPIRGRRLLTIELGSWCCFTCSRPFAFAAVWSWERRSLWGDPAAADPFTRLSKARPKRRLTAIIHSGDGVRKEAGTVIFVGTVILWLLLSFRV